MKTFLILLMLAALVGCGSKTATSGDDASDNVADTSSDALDTSASGTDATAGATDATTAAPDADASADAADTAASIHTYNGSVAAGDFITVTVDHAAGTVAWNNETTSLSGTSTFTEAADGSLVLGDDKGEFKTLYEIPGYALVAQDQKAKDGTQKSLAFAFEKEAITKADLANRTLNMMQFKNRWGGVEIMCGTSDASGTLSTTSYMPANTTGLYSEKSIPGSMFTEDAAKGVLKLTDPAKPGEDLTMFGTKSGLLGIDTPNGAVIGVNAAATPAFDPSVAGTYAMIGFEKQNEANGDYAPSDPYFGTATFVQATFTLTADGTLQNGGGKSGKLSPFKGSAFQGAGKVTQDCNGLFVLDTGEGDAAFVGFQGNTLLFASFKMLTPATTGTGGVQIPATYKYTYGVALKK